MSRILLFYAVLLIFYSDILIASDAYAGFRLFHTPEERLLPASVESTVETEIDSGTGKGQLVIEVTPKVKHRKVNLVRHPISFDGIVIRHGAGGDETEASWINGVSQELKRWHGDSPNDYQLTVSRYGQRITLRVGQQSTVTLGRAGSTR